MSVAGGGAPARIHDVTVPLAGDVDPWPGDVPPSLEATARIRDGDACNVGALHTSLHNGTHADAPLHVEDGAGGAETLPLEAFLGPAVVVDRSRAVDRDPERPGLAGWVPEGHRVLLRSGRDDGRSFPDRVEGVPPAWIRALAGRAVPLLGVDAPSVDPLDSRELPAHRACFDAGVCVLENLDLSGVPAGRYRLVALPLRIEGADAAPVRAVLLEV